MRVVGKKFLTTRVITHEVGPKQWAVMFVSNYFLDTATELRVAEIVQHISKKYPRLIEKYELAFMPVTQDEYLGLVKDKLI